MNQNVFCCCSRHLSLKKNNNLYHGNMDACRNEMKVFKRQHFILTILGVAQLQLITMHS